MRVREKGEEEAWGGRKNSFQNTISKVLF